jgi:hypothetical protein
MAADRTESPKERAPLLLVFGDLAPRVAALVRARPSLVARLVVAPREHIHSVGAFLHLSAAAASPDAEVASAIEAADPRDLLRAALPGCPATLYRALDRAGDRVRERRFYERLGAAARGPFADPLLDGGALDDLRLAHYEALSRMDPAVAALRGALPEDTHLAEGVDCLVALLRARGALRDGDLRLPPRAGVPAVARRLRAALARIEAPDPGFAAPPPYRLVRNTGELQRIGEAFGNCVALPQWGAAQHHLGLIDGTAVFLARDDPPLLVLLRRVADRTWHLEQCFGPKNASPPPGARSALRRDLGAAGLRIVAADPQSALGRLEQEARRGRGGEADPGDADDDLDDAA